MPSVRKSAQGLSNLEDQDKKYKTNTYKPGDKIRRNNSFFKRAYSKPQKSDKLASKQFLAFRIARLTGKNMVEIKLSISKIQNVINVMY